MTDRELQLRAAPSKEAVVKYLLGQEGATQDLIKSFVERSFLIGLGMYVFGERENLMQNSIAGSFAIEVYLLIYYSNQLKK